MENVLNQNNFLKPPKVGEIVKGKIIQKGKPFILVDVGNFKTGIIYGEEILEAKDILKNLKIGDEISAKVIEIENEDGYLELSIQKAKEDLVWEEVKKMKEKGESFPIKIIGLNKGGLLAKVSGLPAFLPLSQISSISISNLENQERGEIMKELQKFVGKELKVKIFNLDYKNKTVILSEKLTNPLL